MLYSALIGALVVFVFSLPKLIKAIVETTKEKNAMNKMIIETPDGQTEVFYYKGKAYDKNMYIDYRVDQFNDLAYKRGRNLSEDDFGEFIKIANIRLNKTDKAAMGAADLAAIQKYQEHLQHYFEADL